MSTSLAAQLQKLAVPQTTHLQRDKKRASLLFDPKEAAAIDRDTFYDIGILGLRDLQKHNPDFLVFEKTLFSLKSKTVERSVENKKFNADLDKNIQKFFGLLSPYFLLLPAHKALEWLINRFAVHDYNKRDLLKLILPYHESNIFARCLQLLNIYDDTDDWFWLRSIQKSGMHLPKLTLYNHAANNVGFLKFLEAMVFDAISAHMQSSDALLSTRVQSLTTLFAFYCTTTIGALRHSTTVTEPQITAILPALLRGLRSEIPDYTASAYMIIAQVLTKTNLSHKVLDSLVQKISSKSQNNLRLEATLLLLLIYQSQRDHYVTVPKKALKCIVRGDWFAKNLSELATSGSYIAPLCITILKAALAMSHLDEYRRFVEGLITHVRVDDSGAGTLIETVLECHLLLKPEENDNVFEDNVQQSETSVTKWYGSLLKQFETQYPNAYDRVTTTTTNSNHKQSLRDIINVQLISDKKHKHNHLFKSIYNTNAAVRAEGIRFLVTGYRNLSPEEKELLHTAITDSLLIDDEYTVVREVLKFKSNDLIDLLGETGFVEFTIKLLMRSTFDVDGLDVVQTLTRISSTSISTLDNILLALLPFLFPLTIEELEISKQILNLNFKYFPATSIDLNSKETAADFCESLYTLLFKNRDNIDVNFILEQIKKTPPHTELHKYLFALLLVSNLPQNASPLICNKLLTHIIPISGSIALNTGGFLDYIQCARKQKPPVQGYLDLLAIIFDRIDCTDNISPDSWLNLCQPNERVKFLINVFVHLLNGCASTNTEVVNIYSEFLKQFLNKFFPTFQQKIIFLCNLITIDNCARLKLNTKTQLRIMKIINYLITESKESLDWALTLNSNKFIPTVLIGLINNVKEMRFISTALLDNISKRAPHSTNKTYIPLISEILKRTEEILLDSEQLPLILFTILSECKHPKLQLIIRTLFEIANDPQAPPYVSSSLLQLLKFINSNEIFEITSKLALNILKSESSGTLNLYHSIALYNIMRRLTVLTAKNLKLNSGSWEFIVLCLKCDKLNLEYKLNKFASSSALILEQIDRDIFVNFDVSVQKTLVKLLVEVATLTEIPEVCSAINRVMKIINLDAKHLLADLETMKDVKSSKSLPQRKFRRSEVPTIDILDTVQWRKGVTILEFIQDKKKLTNANLLLPVLFDILKKCLDFDEQGVVEYPKQIILSSILHCCQKMAEEEEEGGSVTVAAALPANSFNMELVVQCIRASQNPQTHHHALLVLAHTASLMPEQVLHNIMAIFTFMGSSVLRHDDAYSFQIISKLIETIIPILIKGNNNQEVTSVLRVFVDVILDVPEHRRLPLFKKLLTTLEVENYLWLFLLLVFEAHVLHGNDEKPNTSKNRLLDAETMPKRLDIATNISLQFTPDVILKTCIKLIDYLKELPVDKEEHASVSTVLSIAHQSPKQFRHYKYVIITFLSSFLSSKHLVNMIASLNNTEILDMEPNCKSLIISTLTYIQSLSKTVEQMSHTPQAQYWKVILHHCYDTLDSINALLTSEMFLLVIRGLIAHNLPTMRRKAMEILNTKLQHLPSFFYTSPDDTEIKDAEGLFALMPSIIGIIKTTSTEDDDDDGKKKELEPDYELSKQTALLTLKLLVKLLASKHPEKFLPVLDYITDLIKSNQMHGNILASVVLCLSELCSQLRAHAIPGLVKFMPALIKIFKHQKQQESPGLLLMCLITAIQKIIESLPLFLSPYLQKLLVELTVLSTKWTDSKFSTFHKKLNGIRTLIGTAIPSRVLIPIISQAYGTLLNKNEFEAIGPLMHVLAENLTNLRGQELTSLLPDLTTFFLIALQFRAEALSDDVATVEDHIIKTLSVLILKLSETTFRPLYYRLYDWAIRSEARTLRVITFYRLSAGIAESLKGLFVLFAGHFVNNASSLLDACNCSKNDHLYFDDEQNNLLLIESIMKTLNAVFLYDSQQFVDKDRFETLMQPIIDQLENAIDGIENLTSRATNYIIPCIAQFAVATGDDALWKQLNYQILLKTRHNLPAVRLIALNCVCEVARSVGEDFLPLLPETIPFLAELLEDEDEFVESSCQKVVQDLEKILGEPLQKYF